MKKILVLIFIFILAACNNTKNKIIPTDKDKWQTEISPCFEKLNQEEQNLLRAYLQRIYFNESLNGIPIEKGVTIGKAIYLQKEWQKNQEFPEKEKAEYQARKEAYEKSFKKMIENRMKNLEKQIDSILSVNLIEIKLIKKESFFEWPVRHLFKITLQNKSSKDILGIKGQINLIDVFDNKIASIPVYYDQGIKAETILNWDYYQDYKSVFSEQKAIDECREGKKYKAKYESEMIVFADGTKMYAEAKENKVPPNKEKEELQKKVSEVLTVSVREIKLTSSLTSWIHIFKIGLKNIGTKDISGIKGKIFFFDIFDEKLGSVAFQFDKGLNAGNFLEWDFSYDYKDNSEEAKDIDTIRKGRKYKTIFEPETIVFTDGTKII